jgi:hypothetical protein
LKSEHIEILPKSTIVFYYKSLLEDLIYSENDPKPAAQGFFLSAQQLSLPDALIISRLPGLNRRELDIVLEGI